MIRYFIASLILISSYCYSEVNPRTGVYQEDFNDISLSGPLPGALHLIYGCSEQRGYPLTGGWTLDFKLDVKIKGDKQLHPLLITDPQGRLTEVRVLTATGRCLETISLSYDKEQITIRHLTDEYHLIIRENEIAEIEKPDGEKILYQYERGQIALRATSTGHKLQQRIGEEGKVTEQLTNSFPHTEVESLGSYTYFPDHTCFESSSGSRTEYTYNGSLLNLVELYDRENLVLTTRYTWQEELLIQEEELDSSGELLRRKRYSYNEEKDLLAESIEGQLRGEEEEISTHSLLYSDGLVVSEIEDGKATLSYSYDPETHLLISKRGEKREEHYWYDEEGLLKRVRQISLNDEVETEISYTNEGKPKELFSTTSRDGKYLSEVKKLIHYNDRALPIRIEMECGSHFRVIEKEYDKSGRETYSSDSDGNTLLREYDPTGLKVKETNLVTGNTEEMEFNFLGKMVAKQVMKEGLLCIERHLYDIHGRLLQIVDTLGNTTDIVYDSLGRAIQKIEPEVLNEDEELYRPIWSYQYDGLGRVIAFTNPANETTKIRYSVYGKPLTITYPDGREEEYSYEKDGSYIPLISNDPFKNCPLPDISSLKRSSPDNVLSERYEVNAGSPLKRVEMRKSGSKRVITYDALGRPICSELFNTLGLLLEKSELRFDRASRLVLERNYLIEKGKIQKPIITRYKWTVGGDLKSKTEYADLPSARTTHYEWNEKKRLKSVIKPDGVTISYLYNELGELIHLSSSDSSVDESYEYQEGKIVLATNNREGLSVTRGYSEKGQLLIEVLPFGETLLSEYNSNGERIRLTLPDQSAIRYIYQEGRIHRIERVGGGNQTLYFAEYYYDKQGTLQSIVLPGRAGALQLARDLIGRITKVETAHYSESISYFSERIAAVTTFDAQGKVYREFDYDGMGQVLHDADSYLKVDSHYNLLSKGKKSFSLAENHQVLQAGDAHFTWDLNGNLLSMQSKALSFECTYDAMGRLIEVQTDKDKISYLYDPFGRRVAREEKGVSVHYLWDGNSEIGVVDENGNIAELRILGLGRSAEIGAAIALEINGKKFVPLHNWQGSLAELLDMETGKVVECVRQDLFGEEHIFNSQGKEVEQSLSPWRFFSKRSDQTTGLINFGRRDYLPTLCRFIQVDPAENLDSINPYAFLRNDPTMRYDPDGLFSIWGGLEILHDLGSKITRTYHSLFIDILDQFPLVKQAWEGIEEFSVSVMGPRYFPLYFGIYAEPSRLGVWGEGESEKKIRITFINGIMTDQLNLISNIETISKDHGGINVHYCYVGTRGFTRDLIRSMILKFGYTTKEAKALAELWKRLIQEMGGTDSNGMIYHYAHSLGGTETLRAKYLLTPEERRMIKVMTFGSPTLLDDEGFHSVHNLISRRDIISLFDPLTYIKAIVWGVENVIWVGSHFDGAPIMDHPFNNYWAYRSQVQIWEEINRLIDSL